MNFADFIQHPNHAVISVNLNNKPFKKENRTMEAYFSLSYLIFHLAASSQLHIALFKNKQGQFVPVSYIKTSADSFESSEKELILRDWNDAVFTITSVNQQSSSGVRHLRI